MNMAQRIQTLRKEKGISQEELANALNISRQAVSKWESQQSLPDLDNIVALSIYFNVTTDYILKGTQTQIHTKKHIVISKTLYMVSAALLFIGLLFTIFDWYEHVSMYAVLIGIVIQICGGIVMVLQLLFLLQKHIFSSNGVMPLVLCLYRLLF